MKKLVVLSCLFGVLCNCQTVKINQAEKRIHIPGISHGKKTINFAFTLDSKKAFYINSIKLDNYNKLISCFYSNANTGVSSTNIKNEFPSGTYIFGFKIEDVSQFENESSITVEYSVDDVKHLKKIKVQPKRKLLTR